MLSVGVSKEEEGKPCFWASTAFDVSGVFSLRSSIHVSNFLFLPCALFSRDADSQFAVPRPAS
jgi:hypothetical protein